MAGVMYCRRCGSMNDDNAWKCVNCGEVLQSVGQAGVPAQRIPNYLAHSILVTIFCCWPLGIPAIVYAAQVNAKVYAGDIHGALEASRKARMWAWLSFGCGLLVGVMWMIVAAIGALADSGLGH